MNLNFDISVRHQDFTLEAASNLKRPIAGIFGPSGSGKTTLLSALAGLSRNITGSISLNGKLLFDSRTKIFIPPDKRGIGIVFQDARLFPHLNVKNNLMFGTRRNTSLSELTELAKTLDLTHLLHRYPSTLSGGEKKRVALGRAVLAKPKLLLLDEPLAGLDAQKRSTALHWLRKVHERFHTPMLMVSHHMEEILAISEFMIILSQGRVVDAGTCSDLARSSEVLDVIGPQSFDNVIKLRCETDDKESNTCLCRPVLNKPTGPWGARRLPLLKIPANITDKNAPFNVSLNPRDVVISSRPLPGISIQNQLAAKVLSLTQRKQTAICVVDTGVKILAELSPRSVEEQGIRAGRQVWCLFKSEALSAI